MLAVAGTDFSADRARVWPNVTTRKLEVHERGATFAEVTERGRGFGWFLRNALKAVERTLDRPAQPETANAAPS